MFFSWLNINFYIRLQPYLYRGQHWGEKVDDRHGFFGNIYKYKIVAKHPMWEHKYIKQAIWLGWWKLEDFKRDCKRVIPSALGNKSTTGFNASGTQWSWNCTAILHVPSWRDVFSQLKNWPAGGILKFIFWTEVKIKNNLFIKLLMIQN